MHCVIQAIRDCLCSGGICQGKIDTISSKIREATQDPTTSTAQFFTKLKTTQLKPGRYLAYKDPDYGFVIMVMVWGPGDCTPIHDHGTWGVEVVVQNELQITEYDCCNETPQPVRSVVCQEGAVLHQLPQVSEVHKVENLSNTKAVTLHIYGREMSGNKIFVEGQGFCPNNLVTLTNLPKALAF